MDKLIIKDGISQDDRLLSALMEDYINVDEMRFEDLMSLAQGYASFLTFRDAGNRPDGDWRTFFESDEVCVLASILAINLNSSEADSSRFLRKAESLFASLRAGDSIRLDAIPALQLVRKIDAWLVQLARLSSIAASRTQDKIADLIETGLRGELQQLCVFLRAQHVDGVASFLQELSAIWHVAERPNTQHGDTKQFLKANFYSFYNAVTFLQGCAADNLIISLERRNHDPLIGLYIAFLKLFKKVQDKLNSFTQKHLNFYYEDVLKIQRRPFVPDSVNLVFSPDTDGREVLIKKGSEFRANLDENEVELIYTADSELLVNDAKVCSLQTLHFSRNKLSSPENALVAGSDKEEKPGNYATSAKINRQVGGLGEISAGDEELIAHPLFGDPQRSKNKHLFEEARLGFAVASRVLLMKQGLRDVTLTFKLEPSEHVDSPISFSEKLAKVLQTSEADAFFKAFRHMFRITFTGESGWLEIGEYLPLSHVVDERCEANSFKIKIQIPDSAEAVVAYSAALHGENFDTGLPLVKFTINADGYLFPYSFLCELVVQEIVLEVEVKGCTDVLIYNQYGPLSPNAQFNPFGSVPVLGDYFIVSNYEAARKELLTFEVDVEWTGLPQETGGFEDYYCAYPMPFKNDIFKVKLAVLKDRKWLPASENEQPQALMFKSGDASEALENKKTRKKRRFSFRGLCKFMRPLETLSEEDFAYDALAKDGFFKLTLANPAYAFGHRDYPLALSKAMSDNATRKRFAIFKSFMKKTPPKPLPNLAYTPLINAISVNYKAISTINLERAASVDEDFLREKVFHLHPLGLEVLSPKASGKVNLLPQYEADGNLCIGISASKLAGQISLFFHLREDSLPEADAKVFEFSWHYLTSNQWKKMDKSQILSDSTNGFLTSGIVTLEIPSDIDRGNTVLPKDLFWLRVALNGSHLHTLCSLYGVYAQALKVSWKCQDGNSLAHLAQALPAGTIKEAKPSIIGIREIRQIMESFGGAQPENAMQRTIRVSERLRHKNRAVTPWDYERLILQRFPEIYKTKCFPCMTGNAEQKGKVMPGHLLIVVIPYLKESASVNLQPMVNALTLREVRKFVESVASSSLQIHVRNPAYERIQVRCKVRFRPGAGRGIRHEQLNREIVNYLSPWSPLGLKAGFGWCMRCNDMQALIQELDYVESVSGLSMLHIREDDECQHHLADTARKYGGGKLFNEIKPAYPWSIAIPAHRHLLEIVDDKSAWKVEETGIAKLSIGNTFILSRGNQ